jgi:hypothetical protein
MFSTPVDEAASQSDTPDPKSVKLKFTALRSIFQYSLPNSVIDSVKRVMGDTADSGFSPTGWFSAVQVPAYGGAPTLTCTPVPANGATGQALGVTITLTFSNALAGGSENNIGLLRTDTMAAFTVTRSIDPTRKIVTLAHANLVAGKTWLITVNGVKDVFGQYLADAVFNFAT